MQLTLTLDRAAKGPVATGSAIRISLGSRSRYCLGGITSWSAPRYDLLSRIRRRTQIDRRAGLSAAGGLGGGAPRRSAGFDHFGRRRHATWRPFSFFTVVGVVPARMVWLLTIAAQSRRQREEHTLKNIRATEEFCVNVVAGPVWKEMVDPPNGFPEGECEFDKTGLTKIPSTRI